MDGLEGAAVSTLRQTGTICARLVCCRWPCASGRLCYGWKCLQLKFNRFKYDIHAWNMHAIHPHACMHMGFKNISCTGSKKLKAFKVWNAFEFCQVNPPRSLRKGHWQRYLGIRKKNKKRKRRKPFFACMVCGIWMWAHAMSCFSILQLCLSLGIDLAIPRAKREEAHDLDHIIMDAMLEGFDTGVSC